MRMKRTGRILVLASCVLCASGLTEGAARAEGVTWQDLTLEQALAEAAQTGKTIMIDVRADHCMSCGDMDRELWQTAEGAALADGLIPIIFDSTTPEGRALNRRFPITGLPVVIFVRPDGTEIDRVAGYTDKDKFLQEAQLLKGGYDPLPEMEERLAANPTAVSLVLPVLERYLYRSRDAEAESLLVRILELDPENKQGQAALALIKFAKHAKIIWNDDEKSYAYWKMILDRFPDSSSVSGAVSGTYEAAVQLRRLPEWQEWICKIAESQPTNARLHYALAMNAKRSRLRGACFANAARTARSLGFGGAFLDTLAITLEGGTVPGK